MNTALLLVEGLLLTVLLSGLISLVEMVVKVQWLKLTLIAVVSLLVVVALGKCVMNAYAQEPKIKEFTPVTFCQAYEKHKMPHGAYENSTGEHNDKRCSKILGKEISLKKD